MKITGTGILLKTLRDTYLFQERDTNLQRNPGMITPFGGEINSGETPAACAVRELKEELGLVAAEQDLQAIGIFESHFAPGTFIRLFTINNIDPKNFTLYEGQNIVEMTTAQAIADTRVTEFTKEVLMRVKSNI